MVSSITPVSLRHALGKSITSPKGQREKCNFKEFQLRAFGFLGKFNGKARGKLEKFFQGHLAMQCMQEVDALVKHI
jgi:hypothetical protein